MTPDEFIAEARAALGDFVGESGVVLYSSAKTLKPGPIYLLGLNPGSDPDGIDDPDINTHLAKLPSNDVNSYLDAEWDRGRPGQDKFQRRVVWLLRALGLDPREVCSSNLIFRRSRGEGDSGYPGTADRCWPVHQLVLRTVQPRTVICLGNLPFEYVLLRAGFRGEPEEFPSGHGTWACRAAQVQVEGRRMEIVRLPHLSRYNVIGKTEVANWLRRKLLDGTGSSPEEASRPTVQPRPAPAPVSHPPQRIRPALESPENYQIPWNGEDGYIILTGELFSAEGARGRAWETLRTRNGIAVRDWIPLAKRAGNRGCGKGDLKILCDDRRAAVIVDATGRQLYPAVAKPQYWRR